MNKLQIIDWNISFQGYNIQKFEFLFSKVDASCCIMLQEVTPDAYQIISKYYGEKYQFVYSLDFYPMGMFQSKARILGVLLVISKDIQIIECGVVERALMPERTVWATLKTATKQIKVLSVHSLTGCDYKRAKSEQYLSISDFVYYFKPDIIGMDANEPKVDSCQLEQMQFYSNKGNGAKCFFNSIIRENLIDAYVKANDLLQNEDVKVLPISHKVKGGEFVRYDFIFIHESFAIERCEYLYEQAIEAGSDHALILANVLV